MSAEVIMDVSEWHLLLEMDNHSSPAPHIIPVVYIQKIYGRREPRGLTPHGENSSYSWMIWWTDARLFPDDSILYDIKSF